jgi:hypothetical protein
MDVNKDNVTDIICGVGALKGQGYGYTELYLTSPEDGSLVKVQVREFLLFATLGMRVVTGRSRRGLFRVGIWLLRALSA